MSHSRQFSCGDLDLARVSSVEDDGGTVHCQAFGQGEADTLRRASDKGASAFERKQGIAHDIFSALNQRLSIDLLDARRPERGLLAPVAGLALVNPVSRRVQSPAVSGSTAAGRVRNQGQADANSPGLAPTSSVDRVL